MTLQAAVLVFDRHTLDDDGAIASIRCCGDYLVEHANAIACRRCRTVIEREDLENEWRILRFKGRARAREATG